jgi:hypothetical protein
MVFATPPRQFYRDVTNPAHLSGLSHLDNFIVTRKSCPLIGTLQKHMPTPTQTATPYTTGPLSGNSDYAPTRKNSGNTNTQPKVCQIV